jgi:hypothetical protein
MQGQDTLEHTRIHHSHEKMVYRGKEAMQITAHTSPRPLTRKSRTNEHSKTMAEASRAKKKQEQASLKVDKRDKTQVTANAHAK